MADQKEVIREFLVKLGFQIDTRSHHDYDRVLVQAAAGAGKLAAAVLATAAAVAGAVGVMVNHLDTVYFASQRTGASAKNLQAFSYAARQLGATAQEAMATVEGLAERLRTSPGYENMLQGLGVNTRDARGNLRDTVDLLTQVGAKLREMPMAEAKARAGALGIDDKMLLAMRSGDLDRYMESYQKMSQASGLDETVDKAHRMMVQIRQIGEQLGTFGTQIAAALEDILGPLLEKFTAWLATNGPAIAKMIADITAKLVIFAGYYGEYMRIFGKLGEFVYEQLKRVADMVWKATAGVRELISMFSGSVWSKIAPTLSSWTHKFLKTIGAEPESEERPSSPRDQAMAFFVKQGWTTSQAAGIVANIDRESALDPKAVGDNGQAYGVAQWHPDRQAAFERWSGHSIKDSTYQEQLAFVQYELTRGSERSAGAALKATTNAESAGAVMSRQYERPAEADAEAAARGSLAQNIAATTTINVNGVQDPQTVAQRVADSQQETNSMLVRNLKPVAQ